MIKCKFLIWLLLASSSLLAAQPQKNGKISYTPKPSEVAGVERAVISLNGLWDFHPTPGERFFKRPDGKKLAWSAVQVPGEWFMQGFTTAPGTPAAYRKVFSLPDDWDNQVVRVRFDGVYSLTTVYLNGKQVASHEGGFTPFEADLTPFVKYGRHNELILAVQSESLADTLASASQYAAHPLGGITRKAELYVLPRLHITQLALTTDLSADYTDARLEASLSLGGDLKDLTAVSIRLLLQDPRSGELIQERLAAVSRIPNPEKEIRISLPVISPDLWDPEHPHLYPVYVVLEKDGRVLQKIRQQIGLREVTVAGNRVFVNGKAIKLRGVNRHEVHPTRGRSLTMEEWLTDARLFKEANVNYIRTSHYPPAEEFIAICDSLGLFVECEAPLCWVGHGANDHWKREDPHASRLYPLIRQQVLETVAHYRKHPSVIIWSLANESAWGPLWQQVLEEVNATDPSRPVSFHDQAVGGYNNYGSDAVQIANWHYPGPGGPEVAKTFERPMLFGEYAHLNTYNRQEIVTDPGVRDAWGRGLERMYEAMYYSAGCLGGAIWSGIDDVFYLPGGSAVGYGEWGPLDSWRRKKPEYWHLKKVYSPVKIFHRQIDLPEDGEPVRVAVENRHLFTDMKEITIVWRMGLSTGRASLDLEPGATGELQVLTDRQPRAGEVLEIDFLSAQQQVIDQYALLFKGAEPESAGDSSPSIPELHVLERIVQVRQGENTWIFDAPTGRLRQVLAGGKEVIMSGPELFLIPLTSGPCNTEHSLHIEPLNDPCQNWKGRISSTGRDDSGVFVEVTGSYDEADLILTYRFDTTGVVQLEYDILPAADLNPRQIGLGFTAPGTVSLLSWKRVGQWSVYPPDHIGRPVGQAQPFEDGLRETDTFGESPSWTWEQDTHAMGSNDFRATRDRLLEASLTDEAGSGIRMISDGTGAFRAWVSGETISFLAASFSTAGGDMFFSSHLASERQPLQAGVLRKGLVKLRILK